MSQDETRGAVMRRAWDAGVVVAHQNHDRLLPPLTHSLLTHLYPHSFIHSCIARWWGSGGDGGSGGSDGVRAKIENERKRERESWKCCNSTSMHLASLTHLLTHPPTVCVWVCMCECVGSSAGSGVSGWIARKAETNQITIITTHSALIIEYMYLFCREWALITSNAVFCRNLCKYCIDILINNLNISKLQGEYMRERNQ